MARIVAAMAMVHGPRITGAPDRADPAAAQRTWDGFAALRRELEAASPDWALVITNEHLTNPFFPYAAPFTLGLAPRFRAPAEPAAALPEMLVPSDEAISAQLLDMAWAAGFDLAYSHDLLLDHGTTVPLHFLTPHLDLPIVHIHQLVSRGPRPRLRRCYELGGLLRQFIEARPAAERVAVIGTGGLSHWVGNAKMGQVNAAWDQHVLRLFAERRDDELLAMTDAALEAEAGNGAHELRNWITVAGTVPGAPGEVVNYVEHVPAWAQQSVHLRFRLEAG
ncbi:MAG TPA: hypothetical protein VFB73_15115 [Chloroflexota bacterium]|nr:hypothetical protein [Chloroflexota bacterium]